MGTGHGEAGATHNGAFQIITNDEWEQLSQRLGLPPRQMQVIQAIIAGQGKPEAIARTMGIRASSVRTHIERMYITLGAHDRVDVVVKVFAEVLKMREESLVHRP